MRRNAMVYIIDDEPEMCRSLEMLLALDGIPTRSFPSADAFIDQLPRLDAGVIVSDVAMPGLSGIDLLRRLPELERSDAVIMITGHGDVSLAVDALKAGAEDFIEKPFEASRVMDSVRVSRRRIAEGAGIDACAASLSSRERQVLRRIACGMTSKQIAIEFGISHRTVETHRQHIMEKTGTSCMSQLVRFAVKAGLDDLPEACGPAC